MKKKNEQDEYLVKYFKGKGNFPKKYYEGLSNEDKVKRYLHFKENTPKGSRDSSAYGKAPGDQTKTVPSVYTQKYKEMYDKNYSDATSLSKVKVSLKKKSEKTGISYDILYEVYKRGYAAWRTGHRPGANQYQWGLARVNSFIMKGKTWSTTDSDLAKKVNN